MKTILLMLLALLMISCGDNRDRDDLKASCNIKTLDLNTYRPDDFKVFTLPGSNSSIDQVSPAINAKDGKYILSGSIIHIYDQNFRAQNNTSDGQPKYLQMSFGFNKLKQTPEEVAENLVTFETTVNCLANLRSQYAGKSVHQINIPTTLSLLDGGSEVALGGMYSYQMGFFDDGMLRMKKLESNNKGSTNDVNDINPTDTDVITNFYQNTSEKLDQETYQLQNRVTMGKVTITLLNNYIRCVPPSEIEGYNAKSSEEKEALIAEFKACGSQALELGELNNESEPPESE